MPTLLAFLLLLASDWTAADAAARRRAVESLSHPDDADAIPVLVAMRHDDDAGVRAAASAKLHAWGRAALAEYVAFLRDGKDAARPAFRKRAETILMLGASATPPDLAEPLAKSDAPSRRAGAALLAWAPFATIDPGVALDVLAESTKDADPGVRAMAATSLALVGWSTVARAHPLAESKELVSLLASKDPAEQFAAVALLAALRGTGPETVRALRAMAKRDDDQGYLAHEALRVLGLVEKPDVAKRLERAGKALRNPSAAPRGAVEQALFLARESGPAAKPLENDVARIFDAADGRRAVLAAEALLAIAPSNAERVKKKLGPMLRLEVEMEPWDRLGVARVLAQVGAPSLAGVLRWPEPGAAKVPAARELREQGGAFRWVLRAKRLAAEGLAKAGTLPEPVRADLARLAKHPDPRLRYLAARALR